MISLPGGSSEVRKPSRIRFGSSLNGHVHFHVCVVDGVFEQVAGEGDVDARPSSLTTVHRLPPGHRH